MKDTCWNPPSSPWLAPQAEPCETRTVSWNDPERDRCVVAIQTAPRPRGNSLRRTVASLGEWNGPRLIVADGCRPEITGWAIDASGTQEGSSSNLLRLLHGVATRWPGFTRLILLQDDVILALNALEYMSQLAIPEDVGWVAMFAEMWSGWGAGWPRLGVFGRHQRFYDSQCVIMPRNTVLDLLDCRGERPWNRIHGCDLMFNMLGMPFAVHVPNLADHMEGLNSACEHEALGERRSPNFPGTGFDALTLIGGEDHAGLPVP